MHKMEYYGVNKYMCIDLISSASKVNLFYQFLILSRNSPVQSQWASCLKSGNDLPLQHNVAPYGKLSTKSWDNILTIETIIC